MAVAEMYVGEHIDPLVVVPEEMVPKRARRSEWRIVGPLDPGASQPACDGCGKQHEMDGRPIFTHGCRPAAFPAGLCQGLATFPVTDDTVPVGLVEHCPNDRYEPVRNVTGAHGQHYDLLWRRVRGGGPPIPHDHPEVKWTDD